MFQNLGSVARRALNVRNQAVHDRHRAGINTTDLQTVFEADVAKTSNWGDSQGLFPFLFQ